jgi:putative flippase GtrA
MQSKLGSLIESFVHTAFGFVLSILLSLIVSPMFGHSFTLLENIGITAIFTVVAIVRGYVIRRWFNDRIHRAVSRI